ncbi:MAG: hypothetical protein KKA61_03655 [Nanoarchaeota archaeon]|nr:hypothetical protein [Nanoarchaeota archaeon]
MRKIILLVLVIGLFLISGCAEKVEDEETIDDSAGVIEEAPEVTEQEPAEPEEPVEEEAEETEPKEAVELKEKIADRKNKFAITQSSFEIERKTEKTLYFGVMNQKDEASDFTIEFFCDEAMDSRAKPATDIIFEYTDTIESLGKDQVEVFPLVVKATEDAKPTEYRCRALVGPESYAEKAFFITVVNP